MFTGIIEHLGIIKKIENLSVGLRLFIETDIDKLNLGDSIAVNGVCLTVVSINNSIISLDVSSETLLKTTLSKLKADNIVHLELPVSMSKPLGGHFVTGHVDEKIFIKSIEKVGEFTKYIFDGISKPEWICDKGSIALDGISLTMNRLPTQTSVECMLIPHTIANTCFKLLVENDLVNVEYDYIAKIVARQNTLRTMSTQQSYNEEV